MEFLAFKAIAKALVLPPTGFILVILAGLAIGVRHPRRGRALSLAGALAMLALSVPVVARELSRWLDVAPPFTVASARGAQALVILGGGVRRDAPDYGGDTLGRYTLERVRYGARIARLTGLPVLVSGGRVFGGESEAKLMRDALESEFGVSVRWMEDASRTTHENARYSARLLAGAGIGTVVLVTHAVDVARARDEFADAGIAVIPAPTHIPVDHVADWRDWLPSMSGLEASYHALYELGGLAVRMLTPRSAAQAGGSGG